MAHSLPVKIYDLLIHGVSPEGREEGRGRRVLSGAYGGTGLGAAQPDLCSPREKHLERDPSAQY